VAVEAIDRDVQLAIGEPANAEIALVEAALVRLRREDAPVEPVRFVQPEASASLSIDACMARNLSALCNMAISLSP